MFLMLSETVSFRRAAWMRASLIALISIASGATGALAQTHAQAQAPAQKAPTQSQAPAQAGGAVQPAEAPPPAAEPTQPPPPVLSPADEQAMEEIRQPAANLKTAVDTLEKSVERNGENDDELGGLRVDLIGLIDGAHLTLENLRPKADALHQQIDKLGPAPAKDAGPESEQLANERARLNMLAAEIDGALKTSELAQVRARQLYADVQKARQALFAQQILKRSPSPLSPATWHQLVGDVPVAWRQIGDTLSGWISLASRTWMELAALLAGCALLFVILTWLVRRFLAYRLGAAREPPPSFFEQAGAIGWVAPLLALPSLGALGLFAIGLDSLNLLTLEVGQIADTAFPALVIFVAVSALTRAILEPRRPAWRLVDLSTPAARTLTRIVTRIAGVFAGDLIWQEVVRRLYLPLSISVAEMALASLAIAALLLQLVRTVFEPKSAPSGVGGDQTAGDVSPAGTAVAAPVSRLRPYLIKLPVLAVAIAILGLSLLGYIGLARFLSTQVVVTGSAVAVVLVFHLAIRALLGEAGTGIKPFATVLEEKTGLDATQSGALTRSLSLVLNAALALVAVPLILITWGYSLAEALAWLRSAVFGFQVGEIRISIVRILLAVLLFLALVFVTRIAQRWLDKGPLKSQRMDQGIANSIHTAVGYAGFIVAVLVAVSYGGVDITNFAIVAGALSVGIGFGLQSIVNNFVSGLILLVERPIKVGDWVSVKDQLGYVRRISVRSTEIETSDKASLIVPNSDLITSTVTNWTHRNALGRVVVRVGVSYQSDPEQVRDILQKVAAECPGLLQHPPPGVGFDEFGANALEFSVSAVIPDVNKAGGVQSDLRFRILKAFREAGIEMPFQQHDVHLRDLDGVRTLLTRLAEERARQAGMGAVGPGPKTRPES